MVHLNPDRSEVEKPVHHSTWALGVDVGIAKFAALSTGQLIPAPNIFRKQEAALVHALRRLSHIQEFSNKRFSKNWKKAKARVQRLHAGIAAARLDFLHKLTCTISKNHAIVCIENLRIMNMMKSAAGTVEEPGTSVAAKSGLNKSISNHSWGEFFRQLGLQAGVERRKACSGSSKKHQPDLSGVRMCFAPQQADAGTVLLHRKWIRNPHSDLVGAINILRAGLAQLACEVNGDVMLSAAGTTLGSQTDSMSALAA